MVIVCVGCRRRSPRRRLLFEHYPSPCHWQIYLEFDTGASTAGTEVDETGLAHRERQCLSGFPVGDCCAPTDRDMLMYTKQGEYLGTYALEMILIPDYDIRISVLTTGVTVSNDIDMLSNLVAEIVVLLRMAELGLMNSCLSWTATERRQGGNGGKALQSGRSISP